MSVMLVSAQKLVSKRCQNWRISVCQSLFVTRLDDDYDDDDDADICKVHIVSSCI